MCTGELVTIVVHLWMMIQWMTFSILMQCTQKVFDFYSHDWSRHALIQDRCDTLRCCQFIAIGASASPQFWLQIKQECIKKKNNKNNNNTLASSKRTTASETYSRLYHKDIKYTTLMRVFLFIFLAVFNGLNHDLYDCEEKLTCYEVLGVERTAELKQIRKNFQRRALWVRVQY